MERLYICIFTVIFFSMLTIPLIAVKNNETVKKVSVTQKITKTTAKPSNKKTDEENVRIYLSDSKKVKVISLEEYLVGVVMTEMDNSYPDEALKAQAVAAHNMFLWRKKENAQKDYDITDDYSVDQGYLTPEKRKEKYKDSFNKTETRVKKLVKAVKNQLIYYKNEPILALYHDTSGGKTENAKDIWGGDYPYLVAVESVSDLLNPEYLSTVTYTKPEFLARLKTLGGSLSNDESNFVGKIKTTESGTVKTIKIGAKSYTGQSVRKAFSLRSANFDLVYKDKKFIFTVRGFGHGVGMSQYGAKAMANDGDTYEQILEWYYTGCKVKKIEE